MQLSFRAGPFAAEQLNSTIIAGNVTGLTETPSEIVGHIAQGNSTSNLLGSPASAGGFENSTNGNIVGKDDGAGGRTLLPASEVLDPELRDNDGPTKTHALIEGSPAINNGDNRFVGGSQFDQRGEGFARIVGDTVDIGAFEFVPPPPMNTAPVASDYDPSLSEDGTVNVTLIATDAEHDALAFTIIDGPQHGTIADFNAATGNFNYIPDANYSGNDSLTFKVSDGSLESNTATVSFAITAVADAPNFSGTSVVGRENTKIPLQLSASLKDTDGSETLSLKIQLVPTGATFWNGSTAVGQNLGNGIWQFSASEIATLSILPPPNDDANFSLLASFIATESSNGDTAQNQVLSVVTVNPVYQPGELIVVGAEAGAGPRVKLVDVDNGQVIASFLAYDASFRGGVRVAVADLNGDGQAEIITAPGAGTAAIVKVFDIHGIELTDFQTKAYAGFKGGVFVAVGDVNGDGRPDIITSPGCGMTANIKVFKNRVGIISDKPDPIANNPISSFLAFGGTTGATVAAGDFTGDGRAEIVVGNGPGMSPRVRVFDVTTIATTSDPRLAANILELRPMNADDRGGLFVAVGNVRGNSRPEIIVGNGTQGRGRVEMFDSGGTRFKSINAYLGSGAPRNAPVHVAAKNVDSESLDEIITGQGAPGSTGQLRSYDSDATLIDDVFAGEEDFANGFFVA
jgi:hypothetical protein